MQVVGSHKSGLVILSNIAVRRIQMTVLSESSNHYAGCLKFSIQVIRSKPLGQRLIWVNTCDPVSMLVSSDGRYQKFLPTIVVIYNITIIVSITISSICYNNSIQTLKL